MNVCNNTLLHFLVIHTACPFAAFKCTIIGRPLMGRPSTYPGSPVFIPGPYDMCSAAAPRALGAYTWMNRVMNSGPHPPRQDNVHPKGHLSFATSPALSAPGLACALLLRSLALHQCLTHLRYPSRACHCVT
jgi:hypothetical protein